MKLDPAELRRRNMIRPEQMPYKNAMGQTYDSGAFEKILDQGLALADWNGFAARRAGVEGARQAARPRHRLVPRMDRRQRLRGEGQRRRHARRHHRDLLGDAGDGPGHRDQLRAARGRRLRRADRQDPHRPGRHRSRQRLRQRRLALALHRRLGGARRFRADDRAREDARRRGARGVGRRHRIPRRALRRRRHRPRHRPVRARRQAARAARSTSRRRATAGGPTWPNACHVCEVEVDPETGDVRVVSYASVNDIGRVVSPTIARGQVDGGAVQGLGQALCEQVVYDADSGQLVTGSFMDYAVPRADIGVAFRTEFDTSIPCAAQSARRQGRRRARHDRRDAGGDERDRRRARPRRPRPRRREDPDAGDVGARLAGAARSVILSASEGSAPA